MSRSPTDGSKVYRNSEFKCVLINPIIDNLSRLLPIVVSILAQYIIRCTSSISNQYEFYLWCHSNIFELTCLMHQLIQSVMCDIIETNY